jgi:hypothetical protein
MKLMTYFIVIVMALATLSGCAQGPGNSAQVPLMKTERPASPAASISANSGESHMGMSNPPQ